MDMEVLGPIILATFGVFIIMLVFGIVATVKLFKKMGLPGWNAIIPYYGTWKMCQRTTRSKGVAIAYLVLSILLAILQSVVQAETGEPLLESMADSDFIFDPDTPLAPILVIVMLVLIVLSVIVSINFAHSFGKGTGMGILYCIPPISFVLLLVWAFGSMTQYVAPDGDESLMGEPWRKITNMLPAGYGYGYGMGQTYAQQPPMYGQPGAYPQPQQYPSQPQQYPAQQFPTQQNLQPQYPQQGANGYQDPDDYHSGEGFVI